MRIKFEVAVYDLEAARRVDRYLRKYGSVPRIAEFLASQKCGNCQAEVFFLGMTATCDECCMAQAIDVTDEVF